MNIFSKQLLRKPSLTVILALLLAAATAFYTIGCSAWLGATAQFQKIDSLYTTIAVPNQDAHWSGLFYEDDSPCTLLEQTKRSFPGLIAEDTRILLGGHIAGSEALSIYDLGLYDHSTEFDMYSCSMVVLAVQCLSVEESELELTRAIKDENDNIIAYETTTEQSFNASFLLNETISMHSAYDKLPSAETIGLSCKIFTESGEVPFVEGKNYLLFGSYEGPFAIKKPGTWHNDTEANDAEHQSDTDAYHFAYPGLHNIRVDHRVNGFAQFDNCLFSWEEVTGDTGVYSRLTDDALPYFAEYTGTWEDFLCTEEGKIWAEKIIPLCQLNHESVSVILTNNVNSLLLFNTGAASILYGRGIEQQEYADGSPVCLISAAHAQKNNLSVGDKITIDFYQTTAGYREVYSGNSPQPESVLIQEPCRPENRLGITKQYTIVGIYSAPEFLLGQNHFQANTVFVPAASVAYSEVAVSNMFYPLFHSLILKNGMSDEFDAYATELGYPGAFTYFDQGFDQAVDSLSSMEENAMRLLRIGIAVFILVSALCIYLFSRRTSPVVRSMRLLGVSCKCVWLQLFCALAIIIFAATIIGCVLGALLYGWVTDMTLAEVAPLNVASVAAGGAMLLTGLMPIGVIGTYFLASQNLMKVK